MDAFPFATTALLPDGRLHQANPRWLASFGASTSLSELLHPVDVLRLRNALSLRMPTHLPVRLLQGRHWQQGEALLAPRGADALLMLINSAPSGNEPAGAAAEQAELLGNVVHSFNNHLSGMMGFAELAMLDLDRSHATWGQLQTVLDSGDQAVQFTRDLLSCAGRVVLARKPQSLLAWLRGWCEQQAITLRVTADSEPAVDFDAEALAHALVSALEFLREANSSAPTVDASVLALANAEAAAELGLATGHYAVIGFCERSVGVEARHLPRLLAPYYSSKVVRGRKGLGLAPLDGLVRQLGGVVLVLAEPGEGTRIEILLPTLQQGEEIAVPDQPLKKQIWCLSVQPWFAALAHRQLAACGAAVAALSPDEAQALLGSGQRPDLLLTARLRDEAAYANLRQHCQVPTVVWTPFANQLQPRAQGAMLVQFGVDGVTLQRAVGALLRAGNPAG